VTDTVSTDFNALVVGINDYPYVHANPLRGCCNDAERMAALLADVYGFRVYLLLDREATRAGILKGMDDLVRSARPEERVVVHFSGHGSRIKNPDGGTVETLVPHDSGRGKHPNRDVTDQELYRWLLRLSAITPYVTLVIDSCHAGGIVRDLEAPARGIETDERPEALSEKVAYLGNDAPQSAYRDSGPSGWLPMSDRYTLIAACRAAERAREIEDPATGRIHGALSCFLAEELTRVEGRFSCRDLFERVSNRVCTRFQEQNPQLEGAWDRELFGTRHLPPMRFVPIGSRRGKRVEIEMGAVHGLVVGSEWLVYPPGTHRTDGAEPLGRLRIDDVRAVRGGAELLDEVSPGAVVAGGRAVETARPAGLRRLDISLPSDDDVAELVQRIGRSCLLDPAYHERWDFAVRRLAPRDRVSDTTPVPQLGRLTRPTWAVTDGSGRLVMPPKLASSPEAVEQIVLNLEVLARYRALTDLHHPDPEHPLRGSLEIELRRRRPHDDWRVAEPEPNGSIVYEEGDFLGIRLRHSHDKPLYVAILDLGLTGAIRLLYPVRGALRPLPPWRDLTLGGDDEEGERLELYVPEELPYPGETIERALETLVFLASTEPADLGILAQESVRERLSGADGDGGPETWPAPAADRPLATLLRLAIVGISDRDSRAPISQASPELWTVTTRSFWLRRR